MVQRVGCRGPINARRSGLAFGAYWGPQGLHSLGPQGTLNVKARKGAGCRRIPLRGLGEQRDPWVECGWGRGERATVRKWNQERIWWVEASAKEPNQAEGGSPRGPAALSPALLAALADLGATSLSLGGGSGLGFHCLEAL